MKLLEVENLAKSFGGIRAVDSVSMSIHTKHIKGCIGPNGAGKTTFVNLISGVFKPDAGTIRLDGEDIALLPCYQLARKGIARTFQVVRLFQGMTVLEHVMTGCHCRGRVEILTTLFLPNRVRLEEKKIRDESLAILRLVGLDSKIHDDPLTLSFAEQRLVEISRALASKPRLLILDEPAAGMSISEQRELVKILRRLRDEGLTVILIEHRLELIMDLCDEIAVLSFGRKIADGTPEQIKQNPEVIKAYLGSNERDSMSNNLAKKAEIQ